MTTGKPLPPRRRYGGTHEADRSGRLARISAIVETFALGSWAGALAGFALVVAPVSLQLLGPTAQFSKLIGSIIGGLTTLGMVCGVMALSAIAIRVRAFTPVRIETARMLIIAAMLLLALEISRSIVPAMEAIAAPLGGSISGLAAGDPRLARYELLHGESTTLYAIIAAGVYLTIALGALRARDPG